MEWVIPLVLFVVLVGGFVTFMVLNATKKGEASAEGASGAPGIGRDDTPLGDTTQHAGEQDSEGRTVDGQDAAASGGSGRPRQSGYAGTSAPGVDDDDPDGAAHVARPGEAEAGRNLEFEGEQPER